MMCVRADGSECRVGLVGQVAWARRLAWLAGVVRRRLVSPSSSFFCTKSARNNMQLLYWILGFRERKVKETLMDVGILLFGIACLCVCCVLPPMMITVPCVTGIRWI